MVAWFRPLLSFALLFGATFAWAGPERHELELLALKDPSEALRRINLARDTALAKNDQTLLSALALAENNACRVLANWPCQLRASQSAVQAAKLAGPGAVAYFQKGMIQLARAQINLRDLTAAEKTLAEVRKSLDQADETEQRADLFLAYSTLSVRLGRSELSMQYARDGLAVLQDHPEFAELNVRLMRNLVQAMVDAGELVAARPIAVKLVRDVEALDDPKLQAEVWQARSRIARREHDADTTAVMASRIRSHAKLLKATQLEGMADEIDGYAEIERGHAVTAVQFLEKARESFARLGYDRDELRLARVLADQYVALQDNTGIVRMVQRLNELSDRIAKTERQKAADDFDEQLKYARQEFEVEQLNAQNREAKARAESLRQKNILALSLIVISLCALIGIGFLFLAQRRTAKRLEASMREKQNALTNTSHDIRNPINGILGIAELMLSSPLNAEQGKHVRSIRDAGRALQSLAQDLLDRGRLESGRFELNLAPMSPRSMLEGLGDLYRAKAQEKGLALEVHVGPGIPEHVMADEQRLHQVLSNLIGNALKFTPQGRIDLGLTAIESDERRAHPVLRFEVRDSGPGISNEDQAILFKPFEKGRHGHEHGSGAGLGLSISHDLIALMGGKLQVQSKLGQGSCFFFELPLEVTEASHSGARPLMAKAAPEMLKGLNVLVVDDDAINRILLSTQFEGLDCNVHVCATASAALEAYRREAFDVVVLDFEMPEMNGGELATAIRALPALGKRTPRFVMISGHHPDGKTGRQQVDHWIVKPYTLDDLLEALGSLPHTRESRV